jgi:hypothetical protein
MLLTSRGARIGVCAFALAVLCALAADGQKPADPLPGPRAFLAEGKLDKSEAALHDYLAAHPASADAHFLLGYVLFREKKATESLAEFTAGARTRHPKAEEFKTPRSGLPKLPARLPMTPMPGIFWAAPNSMKTALPTRCRVLNAR